jgi:hypothetical protein
VKSRELRGKGWCSPEMGSNGRVFCLCDQMSKISDHAELGRGTLESKVKAFVLSLVLSALEFCDAGFSTGERRLPPFPHRTRKGWGTRRFRCSIGGNNWDGRAEACAWIRYALAAWAFCIRRRAWVIRSATSKGFTRQGRLFSSRNVRTSGSATLENVNSKCFSMPEQLSTSQL